MAKATPATMVLEKAGVAFKLHEYDYDPDADRCAYGVSARHTRQSEAISPGLALSSVDILAYL